ncbi:Metallo-dependent hydrolase [Glarea lozoyensis ATCC 20868]|uniref:Metallo-dependent hydrolase n=1 Tax=Glarea lozoyensis (strain ATCC 20868 / MF5171) TaxID=1116229 RepID=S3DWI6_GLAL2|nr:Metallo-dependent hydrolase [Glarea lozoyensis ATCC 20868]EPE30743.1 Metallo-dependent hydrolase [Glarea lozoyensis ATCC 20868]
MARGTIAIEEAVISPADIASVTEWQSLLSPSFDPSKPVASYSTRLLDIHGARLQQMDENGVEYMLLSLTSPGCQGESDPETATQVARDANDYLTAEVAKNPQRFGAFAAISMHNSQDAITELRRAVKELGMFGALINDFQSHGPDGTEKLYYDTPAYDPFWEAVQELNVPVYIHPRYRIKPELEPGTMYGSRKHLLGAGVQFHLDLSFHIYAICSSGLFDRYPGVQLVVGHLGEGIPFNLWRASHWLNSPLKKPSRPCAQDYAYYFKHNIHVTTSGFFSTEALKFCTGQIGIERCLFAIDYPYDQVKEAMDWWKGAELEEDEKEVIGRTNAIKLFKLPLEI